MITGKTPSGLIVILTDEEEKAIAKRALEDKVHSHVNRGPELRKAVYSSMGSAVGLAVGGFIAGMVAEWWRTRDRGNS